MVAGDLVNTASRIQSIAPPGTVFVGMRHAGPPSRRSPTRTPAHGLEGKDGLFPLWQALRVVSGARGSLKSQGLEAPFVGRDRELRLIKEVFHGCADEVHSISCRSRGLQGSARAGSLGSSTSTSTACRSSRTGTEAVVSRTGRSVTYWALADMVRCAAGSPRTSREPAPWRSCKPWSRSTSSTTRSGASWSRASHSCSGWKMGPDFERDDLFSAWRTFFERLAEVNPVVMVFEDVQWADDSLLDFVDYLLERSRGFPLFVCTLARPELHERRPAWNRGATELHLAVPGTAVAHGDGPAPDRPRAGAARRAARANPGRAEGIPLYAVETVRMLLDRGALVQDGPVYRPDGPIAALEVPETLQALIAARLDGLAPEGGGCSRTPRSSARRSPSAGWQRCSALARQSWADARLARPQGGARRPGRSSLPRARPVQLRPGPGPPRRLRDAVETGAPLAAPRRCRAHPVLLSRR